MENRDNEVFRTGNQQPNEITKNNLAEQGLVEDTDMAACTAVEGTSQVLEAVVGCTWEVAALGSDIERRCPSQVLLGPARSTGYSPWRR